MGPSDIHSSGTTLLSSIALILSLGLCSSKLWTSPGLTSASIADLQWLCVSGVLSESGLGKLSCWRGDIKALLHKGQYNDRHSILMFSHAWPHEIRSCTPDKVKSWGDWENFGEFLINSFFFWSNFNVSINDVMRAVNAQTQDIKCGFNF